MAEQVPQPQILTAIVQISASISLHQVASEANLLLRAVTRIRDRWQPLGRRESSKNSSAGGKGKP